MNTTEKKAFDPLVCFTFFGSWARTINKIEEQMGVEAAYTMYVAIAEYSMYATDPDFSDYPLLSILWPTIEREVDSSVNNRKRGFAKDEYDEKRQAIIQARINNPDASIRKIAAMTGSSKSTVERTLRECAAELSAALSNDVCSADNNTCNDSTVESAFDSLIDGAINCINGSDFNSGVDSATDNGNDSDSMGRDTGQIEETMSMEEEYEALLMEEAEELVSKHGLSLDEALAFLRSQQEEFEDELPF